MVSNSRNLSHSGLNLVAGSLASKTQSKAIKTSSDSEENNSITDSINSTKPETAVTKSESPAQQVSKLFSNLNSKSLQNFASTNASGAASSMPWLGGGAFSLSPTPPSGKSVNDGSKQNQDLNLARNNNPKDPLSNVPELPKLPKNLTGNKDPLVPNPDNIKLSQTEFDVIRLTNALRQTAGLDPLIVKANLVDTARLSSQKMDNLGSLEHGLTSGWRGENIANGQSSAEEVVNTWKNSPGHFKNMMGDFKYIGVGDTTDDRGSSFWTQQFQ